MKILKIFSIIAAVLVVSGSCYFIALSMRYKHVGNGLVMFDTWKKQYVSVNENGRVIKWT